MSRSYKKYPLIKCETSCKFGKRQANKCIRNLPINEDIPNGRAYKKYYCSWNICDYKCVEFKEWVIQKWYANQKDKLYGVRNYTHYADEPTLEEELNLWKKSYKFK